MNILPKVNLTPLPPITDEDLAIVPGTTSTMIRMVKGLSSAPTMAEDYDFIGCDGRLVRIPNSMRRLNAKLEGPALAAYLLRLTLTGDQRLALDTDDQLWVRCEGCWRPVTDILALTEEKGRGYDDFIKATLAKHDSMLPRLQLGVRFSNLALLRGGGTVTPDDQRFRFPWAMTLDNREFTDERVRIGLEAAAKVTAGRDDARMLCRVAAAPLMRDHLQYIYDLLGTGGNGKGQFLKALLKLYGGLGSAFSFSDFAGVGKVSPTAYEQASLPLTNHLLAVDTEVPDPGLGDQARVKKAAAGEYVSLRLLGRNKSEALAVAVMVMASNRAPSIESDPSQDRRWRYVNFDKRGKVVDDWWRALEYDDLIIDLFMAGCVEWLTDPVGVNPRPGLVNDLDDWGTEVLTQFLEIGTPDPKLGFDPNAYLPSSLVTVPESKRDKNAQLGMMGLASTPKYDILRLAGDEPRMRRSFVIADLKRFAKFAKFATAMLRERDTTRTDRHAPEPELDGPTAQNALTPAGLRAFKPRNIPFGDLETMLGAMRWKGNVFSLRGGTGHDAKAPKGDLKPMLETFEDFVVDHCQANEPMRGLAPAPGLMVLDLDIPKGADEGKPDGLAVLEALDVGLGDPALAVRTASGGWHLYYRIPDDATIPQIAHKGASAPLPNLPSYEGGVPIDTRIGGRGYVVLPGSTLPDGRGWRVVYEGSSTGDHTLPDGLLKLIEYLAAPKRKPTPKPRPSYPAAPVNGSHMPHMDMTPVAEGSRNDTMKDQVWGWLNRAREHGMSEAQRDYGLDRIRERFTASGLSDREIEDCIRRTSAKLGL